MSDEGKIAYGIRMDTSQLQQDADKAKKVFKNLSDTTQQEGAKMDNTFAKLGAGIGVALSIAQVGMFAKQIATVRGEFQQLEVAFKTMLGSKVQSEKLMAQMIQTAATTPFDLKTVAGGAKSLLAYGSAAEEVNGELVMLGDIASGLSIPLGDLVYLYGTTRTQGRLYMQDFNQFMGRGIPIAEELAKQFGVQKDKVRDLVTEGRVGFPEIQKALKGMTSDGGRFSGLMEATSKTITGQMSNLGDSISQMMNEIGKSSEGAISGTIAGAAMLVENYEKIGRLLAVLITGYGAAKAATIAYAAAQTLVNANAVATRYLGMSQAIGALTISHKAAAVGIALQAKAQAALNAVQRLNPYVAVTSLLIAMAAALWALKDRTTDAEKATEEFNKRQKEAADAEQERKQATDELIDSATNMNLSDKQRAEAMMELRRIYPGLLNNIQLETLSLEELLDVKMRLAEYDANKAGLKFKQDYDAQVNTIKKLEAEIQKLNGLNPEYTETQRTILQQRLNKERAMLKEYNQQANKDRETAFIAGIGKLGDAELKRQISIREQTLYALKGKNETTVAKVGSLGYFTADELKAQNEALQVELSSRSQIIVKDKAYWEERKKVAQAAQDALGQEKVNSKEWKDQQKIINESDRALSARSNKTRRAGAGSSQTNTIDEVVAVSDKELIRKREDLQLEARESAISIQKDGTEKQLQAIELDNDRKMQQLKRMQEDELAEILKYETDKWQAAGKVGEKPTTATLPESSLAAYKTMAESQKAAYLQAKEQTWKEALAKYETYKERENAINEKYTQFENDLANSPASEATRTAKLKKAEAERKKELKAIQDEILEASGLLDLYTGNGAEFINKKIAEAYPLLEDISKLTQKELKNLGEYIDKIDFTPEQIASIKEAGLTLEEFIKLLEKYKKQATGDTDDQGFKNIQKLAAQLSASFRDLGNALESFDGVIADIGAGLAGAASQVDNVVVMFDKEATIGDKISAGISGIADILSMVGAQIAANKKAQEEWSDAIAESNHQLALGRIEALEAKETNIFGVENPYARAISGAKQYAQSMAELNAMTSALAGGQVQTGTKKVVSWGNVGKGAGAGAGAGAAIGSMIMPGIGTAIGAGIGALIGGITGALSRKTVPVMESLVSKYGELFNSETFELNPAILADYNKLDDATKKLVDNWDEIKDKAKEAEEQMRETFRDLAGNIGDDLSSALINAFKNGDIYKSLDEFKKAVSKTIESIIQQMVFSKYFENLFTRLEEEMTSSFDAGGDQTIVDDIMKFMSDYPGQVEAYNKEMLALQEWALKEGYDLFQSNDRTGVSKGIASASQDSIDELNGRFTAIQGHTYSINQQMKQVINNGAAVLSYLTAINASTTSIATDMKQVKAGIESINTRGINVKL